MHTVFNFGLKKKRKNNWLPLGVGGRGKGGGHSLPLSILLSSTSHTFFPLCLPTPTLHYITPIFSLVRGSETWYFWQAVIKCIIFDQSLGSPFIVGEEIIFSRWTLLQTSFHRPGYLSLTIDSSNLIAIAVSNVYSLALIPNSGIMPFRNETKKPNVKLRIQYSYLIPYFYGVVSLIAYEKLWYSQQI